MLPAADGESRGMIAMMLALQEASASLPREAILAIDFDLARPPKPSPSPGDIVVTARRQSQRLPPLPDLREDLLPKAETKLFGGKAAIVTEAHGLPGGVTSNRIMLRWKMKF
jgi:hypothetical protein